VNVDRFASIKTWLTEIYRLASVGSTVDLAALRVAMRDALPRDFFPEQSTARYFRDGQLNALAVFIVNPQDPFLEKAERFIQWLGKRIAQDSSCRQVTAAETSLALQVETPVAQQVLRLFCTIHGLCNGWEPSVDKLTAVKVYVSDPYTALDLITFRSMKEYMTPLVDEAIAAEQAIARSTRPRQPHQPEPPPTQVTPELRIIPGTAFLLMHMDRARIELQSVCDSIKQVCKRFGLRAERADDIEHSDKISTVILSRIAQAEQIIVDLSAERPNVYYELGYAHALGKRPILYRRRGEKLHFDVADYNVPEYESLRDLEGQLLRRLENVLGRPPSPQ